LVWPVQFNFIHVPLNLHSLTSVLKVFNFLFKYISIWNYIQGSNYSVRTQTKPHQCSHKIIDVSQNQTSCAYHGRWARTK
jgi:hypothetical protein